jgi:hypothetical protein
VATLRRPFHSEKLTIAAIVDDLGGGILDGAQLAGGCRPPRSTLEMADVGLSVSPAKEGHDETLPEGLCWPHIAGARSCGQVPALDAFVALRYKQIRLGKPTLTTQPSGDVERNQPHTSCRTRVRVIAHEASALAWLPGSGATGGWGSGGV